MTLKKLTNLRGPAGRKGDRGEKGDRGLEGLPGVNAVANDTATGGYIDSLGSQTRAKLAKNFASRSGPLLMSVPTTATLKNMAANLPAAGGFIRLDDAVVLDDLLELDQPVSIVGNGKSASRLRGPNLDETVIRLIGGPGQALRNVTYENFFDGVRTSDDIELINPWYTTLENVELKLSQNAKAKGGIRIFSDAGQPNPGEAFQTQLLNVWNRNGRLSIQGVSDGKVVGGYTAAAFTDAAGAIEMRNASGWNFSNHDVTPSINAGFYMSGPMTFLSIQGGQGDGAYPDLQTGPFFKVKDDGSAYVRGLHVSGVELYNHWGTVFDLFDVRGAYVNCLLRDNNKGNISAPEISVRASRLNKFDCYHKMGAARTNPGLLYTEDASSSYNYVTGRVEDTDGSYLPPFIVAQPTTTVTGWKAA